VNALNIFKTKPGYMNLGPVDAQAVGREMVTKTITLVKAVEEPTIGELVRRYAQSNRADGKSPKTILWYREMLNQLLEYLNARQNPSYIATFTMDTVREYILYLRQRPKFRGHPYTPEQIKLLSPRTVQCHVRALKAFSSWLFAEKYTVDNRLRNLKLPKAPANMVEPLTPEEVRIIISNIDKNSPSGLRNHAMLLTMLDGGFRASEEANINLGQVNFEGGYIKVLGKGSKERIVPIGKVTQKALWQYITLSRPKPIIDDCDKLFLSSCGCPITVNTIKLLFSRLARISGVRRLHAHLCRHTFAINYLLNGGDIFSLQQILGHTTLEMVRHYLHFTTAQVTALHHKYSPMDKLWDDGAKGGLVV
jgi:site-specific recombinase XerD